ncbi:hypothetical protein QN277_023261 [Acacia crassicarpa]|uniref:Membrane protein of ER body-like protein n=1 Tax=Acacia crassicarpa TaxID=499986 RepID=A0AAE1JKW8_9FABA|nr:hypothetical protein QN277_023261 [Acacia crassicarpa]
MEGEMKQWKEEEAAEVEEHSLVKRQAHHHMHVTSTTMTASKLEVLATEQTNGSSGLTYEQEIIQTEVNSGDIEKKTNLHPLDPVIHVDSSLFSSVRTESERVGVITENVQQLKDLYLEGLYQKTPTQGFYCPNCKTCIEKVLLVEETSAPAPPTPPPPRPPFRCDSCFSFLIPIGRCLFPGWLPEEKIPTIPDDINISGKPEQPPQLEEVPEPPGVDQESRSSTTWEILKSTVYGGLVESIASLGIVTSSASSDATTLNILVLSLANLIGGLFIIVHNIWDLKSEQPRTNNVTNVGVDRYYQVLGKRKHFYLHVFMAIQSFIIFGLVPPLVYAFTFTESNNKDLKLAAVAVASAICITLLSIAKAHIQRPNSYLTYLKTVLQYLSTGAMTSVVSYLAGELVKELIEKLGWFDTKSSSFALLLPEMSSEKSRFGSY